MVVWIQLVQALEACHDHHAVALQLGGDALRLQLGDAVFFRLNRPIVMVFG